MMWAFLAVVLAADTEPLVLESAARRTPGTTMDHSNLGRSNVPTQVRSVNGVARGSVSDTRRWEVHWVTRGGATVSMPDLFTHFDDPTTMARYEKNRRFRVGFLAVSGVLAVGQLGAGGMLAGSNSAELEVTDFADSSVWRAADEARLRDRNIGLALLATGGLSALASAGLSFRFGRRAKDPTTWYPKADLKERIRDFNHGLTGEGH